MKTFTQRIFLLPLLLAIFSYSFGQQKKAPPKPKGPKTIVTQNARLLAQDGSDMEFQAKTGVFNERGEEIIRCGSVEMNEKFNKVGPDGKNRDQRFEEWMATQMDHIKAKMSANKTAAVVYTIPTVVHVIHETGTPIGTAENISDAQVMSQMDVLNEDFQRLNADAASTPAAFLPVAADCQIEFCMAAIDPGGNPTNGILRTAMDGAPWASNDVDNIIKPATQWNPNDYFNMWSVDIGGGLLGWAQFPDEPTPPIGGIGASGPANQDGVVNLASSMGRPPASSAPGPYNYGRTATHEVGHWLGLRHIWGDGPCGTDDFCGDTPLASGSNFGCPNVNSCADTPINHPDMVQNYMDYSDDLCMNLFTLDQKARMFAVLDPATGSARRNTLPTSGKCDTSPRVSFANSNTYIDEGDPGMGPFDCRVAGVISIPITIGGPPTGDAIIDVSLSGTPTATEGIDWDFVTTNNTFLSGSSTPITIDVMIYGDADLEGDEYFVLQYTLSGVTDAFTGTTNQTDTIWILNDDSEPMGVYNVTIFSENFDAAPIGDVVHLGYNGIGVFHDAGNNDWMFGTGSVFANAAYISRNSTANSYQATSVSVSYLEMPFVDPTIYQNLVLELDWSCDAEPGYDYGMVTITQDDVNWFTLAGPLEAVVGQQHEVIPIPAMFEGAPFKISFDWTNDGSVRNNPPLAVDNVIITASNNQPVETVLSILEDQYVGPNSDVYFLNPANGNVMLRITNASGFDYGCVSVQIDRAGTGAVLYDDPDIQYSGTQKTFLITPDNNNPAGTYDIRLYFTEAEISGWESISGQSRNNIRISKTNGPVANITPGTPTGNGPGNVNSMGEVRGVYTNTPNDFWVEGTFSTGFSGFVARIPSPLAIEFADFEVSKNGDNSDLKWIVNPSATITSFDVMRSTDGTHFDQVGSVNFKDGEADYTYVDKNISTLNSGVVFYRIIGHEVDGSESASTIEFVTLEFEKGVSVYPNPFTNEVSVDFVGELNSETSITMVDITGKQIRDASLSTEYGINHISLGNLSDLPSGVYFVRISNNGNTTVRKLIKE